MAKDGAYARLVEAQRLRDSDSADGTHTPSDAQGPSGAAPEDSEGTLKRAATLAHTGTQTSVNSGGIKARQDAITAAKDKEYSLYYLFKRMGKINRTEWTKYGFAIIASIASGSIYPAFGIVYGTSAVILVARV